MELDLAGLTVVDRGLRQVEDSAGASVGMPDEIGDPAASGMGGNPNGSLDPFLGSVDLHPDVSGRHFSLGGLGRGGHLLYYSTFDA